MSASRIAEMMVGSEFPGDNNDTLMDVQHAVYGEMVVRLFTGPRDRYLAAAVLLRVEDRLSGHLRSMNGFDHRTLQLAHDRIAAGIIVGIMLLLSLCHFYFSRGKTGIDAALNYTAQLASTCAVMLVVFNLRFTTWAATWYGVSPTEIQSLVPTWMVPVLTSVLFLWAGVLLALTRPKSGNR